MIQVLLHLRSGVLGGARSGNPMDQVIRYQMLRTLYLFMGRRPAQNGLDLVYNLLGYTAGLRDMRLLCQVLCQKFTAAIAGVLDDGDHELRTIELVQGSVGSLQTGSQTLERPVIVLWRNTLIEHNPICDLSRQLQHLRTGRPNVDGDIARLFSAMHHI